MRVLLVGEGTHELGDSLGAAPSGIAQGALEALVRRLNPDVTGVERRRVAHRLQRIHGKGGSWTKVARYWLRNAADEGFDALVLVVDEDGTGADRARQMDIVQDDVASGLPRALGVAVQAFDAWLLADESALSTVLGRAIDARSAPEEIRDPKRELGNLIESSACELRPREIYARIAVEARLGHVEKRCPKGFRVFAARVRALGHRAKVD